MWESSVLAFTEATARSLNEDADGNAKREYQRLHARQHVQEFVDQRRRAGEREEHLLNTAIKRSFEYLAYRNGLEESQE